MSAWSGPQADAADRLVGVVRRNARHTLPGILLCRMGYHKVKPHLLKRLARVLGDDLLGLDETSFDFVYTSERFAERLCEVLKVESLLIEEGMAGLQERVARRNAFVPFLFVDTNFRRSTQPIFVLAFMESHRRILFSRTFRDLDRSAQVTLAGRKARAHYAECKGGLPVWGKIQRYQFHQNADRLVILNSEGALVRVQTSCRLPAARLDHKGRSIHESVIAEPEFIAGE